MTAIRHHIPEPILQAYAAGRLQHVFAVVVASHVSLCDECRATVEAQEAAGGAVLEAAEAAPVADNLRERVLAALDDTAPAAAPVFGRSGIFPGAVMAELKGRPPRWRKLGGGIRQCILSEGREGSARLLYIPPGQAVPDHGHTGLEMTLVLQGSFTDATGRFGAGDVEIAEEDLDHQPVAGDAAPCICLAATAAPLRFNAFIPRLLQPVFRI